MSLTPSYPTVAIPNQKTPRLEDLEPEIAKTNLGIQIPTPTPPFLKDPPKNLTPSDIHLLSVNSCTV